jgi:gliding motility-associated-like protein
MNYHYLGNNLYEVTLTVYRDCYNGIPPFDNPAAIGVFNSNNQLISNLHVQITVPPQQVPNAINSPCLIPPTDVCYEVAQYVFTLTLPAGAGAYTIAYQRCCRNGSIVNLANVQGTGATYFAVIPDRTLVPVNSNPVFTNWPPTFICKDAPFTFDHSAIDADGDSLVYEVSNPFEGGDQTFPIPDPPNNPPYNNVTFIAPYSMFDPFGGDPLQINSSTGILKATPNSQGQFVYGIKVKEYRNGVLIGETVRDFQVNVVDCPNITVASIYSPTISCGSLDANFINTSFNAATYNWFFGDPTTLNDTSTLKNPTYTYPDTGDYIATLVAYSGINPDCNDTAQGIVHVYPEFMTDYYMSGKHCSNVFSFSDMSYGLSGNATYWLWNFGDNEVSFDPDPVHTFVNPGDYDVMLITSADSSCLDTMIKKVHVLPVPVSNFSFVLDTCSLKIILKDSSTYTSGYRWEFGDWTSAFFKEGTHKYNAPGTYDISLIVSSDSSCYDTSYSQVTIPPLPIPDFDYTVAVCDSEVQFINLSMNHINSVWEFGDSDTSQQESPKHIYSISGTVPVTLTIKSQFNCPGILNKDIFFISKKEPYFDFSVDSCKGEIQFIDLSNRAAFYRWDFGDGTSSASTNPVHIYKSEGEHIVKLIVNDETTCADSITKTINYEAPLGEKVFIPNSFTPNNDGHNDIYSISIFRPCETYKLTIYNRWGQKIFETDDATNVHWDGSFNGERLGEDVYVYILENNGNRKEGTITILR